MANEQFANLDEKYKPTTIHDIVGQPNIQRKLMNWVSTGRVPHQMYVGPPGVGKTSTAVALAKDLWGANWRFNLHQYNASDTRGIDFIRGEIQSIVQTVPVGAPYQIVFLDEADYLTAEAQTALREIMQRHTDKTKFILSCNYPHKIITPIKDRCAIMRFGMLPENIIAKRLNEICIAEGIGHEVGTLELIASHANGSLRKAIQFIDQYRDASNNITTSQVKEDMQILDAHDIKQLLKSAFVGDVEAYEMQLFKLYYDGGFQASELLSEILTEINQCKFDQIIKQALIIQTAKYDWRISQGSNELLQMRCYLATLKNIVNGTNVASGYID